MEALRAALKNDPAVPLDVAALEIASIECPGLAPAPYLSALDDIAARIDECLGRGAGGSQFIEATNHCLFEKLRFRGNEQEYYDVRNSCLNEVLDRKLGIPITLAVVYIEVARRLRRPVFGIGLPGHFIVQYDDDVYSTFIDPFHGGKLLTLEDCRTLAHGIAGVDLRPGSDMLKPVTNRYILVRMLNNLRSAYFRVQKHRNAIAVLNLLIEASPSAPEHYRNRGVARLQVKELRAASLDFGRYLQLSPDAQDRDEVTKQIEAIHRWMASVN